MAVLASPPTKPHHCEITCKTESNFWDNFKTGAEILGILLLAVYTFYTIKMYGTNKQATEAATKAANIADKTMKVAYRPRINLLSLNSAARVSTKDGKLTIELRDGRYFQIEVPIRNTGASPAINFALSRFDAVIGEKGNARRPEYREYLATPHVIVSNVDSNTVIPGTEDISQRIKQITKGNVWLEFSVLISYDDEFGQTHHSEFCSLFTVVGPTDICPWPVQND